MGYRKSLNHNMTKQAPAELSFAQPLDFVHHDQPWMDGLLTYGDADYSRLSGNKHCIHHSRSKLHNAIPDQFQYLDGIYYMLSQMREQLGCEDGRGPSLKSAQLAEAYHTDNDCLGKDLRMPVWCQKIHSQEFHLCPSYQQVHH